MFEEEGKKYASNLELIYKKGVLDGYNKANEWHYIRDKDLPKNSNKVVGRDILENPFITWYENKEWKDENGETLTTNIIAWKEIVPPNIKEDSK